MEPPNRLMKEAKTFQKILKLFPHRTLFFNTLSSEWPPHVAQISNAVQSFQVDDHLWRSLTRANLPVFKHTVDTPLKIKCGPLPYTRDRVFFSLQFFVRKSLTMYVSLIDYTENIQMFVWIFSMTFKRFWE